MHLSWVYSRVFYCHKLKVKCLIREKVLLSQVERVTRLIRPNKLETTLIYPLYPATFPQ